MQSIVRTGRLHIGGMTCVNCQNKIEKKLRNTAGIKSAQVSYSAGTADISYDTDIISLRDIAAVIEKLDYSVLPGGERQGPRTGRMVGTLVLILSLYVLLQQFGVLNLLAPSQLADTRMGYGMLFVIGLITSVHCVAMCGGINLSQCIPQGDAPAAKHSRFAAFAPPLLYNLGRVIAYTAIGFILGFVGLLFGSGSKAGLPNLLQGALKLLAGAFMVIMGLNMLGIFPWLRRLTPRLPRMFTRNAGGEKAGNRSPLIVGLLNGLMPCGPLQSMQIVALASGNPLVGAFSMLFFSLGTVPLMLGLGSAVSALGKRFTQTVMSVGAVLVVALGLAMLSQGGSLSGLLPPDLLLPAVAALCAVGVVCSIPFRKPLYRAFCTVAAVGVAILSLVFWNQWGTLSGGMADTPSAPVVDGKQVVSSTLSSGRYPDITVRVGTPVKWVIDAPKGSINGCNNRIFIPEYDIEYAFKTGENIIEFTPQRVGTVRYSCWMGMIRATITVTEAGESASAETANAGGSLVAALSGPVPAGYIIPAD
ncbi:MAG: sulfite exporter TauE/SafE family protein, partial [Oscillospiraceae bacterium]|nr:sulfite exporter TauE/SafE family protein [Oscillospiraceae bacterium]